MFDLKVLSRFWSKVRKTPDCWYWTAGGRGKTGYGSLKIDGKVVDAHRVSYMIHYGPIEPGLCVLHTCDNRKCVNPEHLFQGTKADNHADMVSKDRRQKPKKGRRAPVRHGTIAEYKTFGCRCTECKTAQANHMKQWRLSVATSSK